MRQILLIGIGQTGSIIAESFLNKMNKRGVFCRALAIDTDIRALSEISGPQKVYMVEDGSIEDVVKKLGEKDVMRYFPCDWENDRSMLIKGVDMRNGANLWRMKAFLAFNSFLSDNEKADEFHSTLDAVIADCADDGEIELYTASSLAGGTGSGLLLPVVLYVKQYLKEKGAKIAHSGAFLAMPDVYKSALSHERLEKGNANAYAALRELNAVNTVAYSDGDAEKLNTCPTINFKIQLSRGSCKTLFDSTDEKFRTADAAPFDKMTLFESIPTLSSVSEHIDVITDALFFEAGEGHSNTPNAKNIGNVIGSTSVSRVSYPLDSIVEYIIKKQLLTFVSDEIGNVTDTYEKLMFSKKMNAKNERRRVGDDFETRRDSYIQTVENMLWGVNATPDTVIGRSSDPYSVNEWSIDLYDSMWGGRLDELIEKSVLNEDFLYIKKVIDDSKKTEEPDENQKKRKKTKKLSPAQIKAETEELVSLVKPRLSNAFLTAQRTLIEGKDKFISSITALEGDEFTVANDIICEKGGFIHPVFALFKLCIAHRTLEWYKTTESPVPETFEENYPFPEKIALIEAKKIRNKKKTKLKYSAYGEMRFADLLSYKYGRDAIVNDDERKTEIIADSKVMFLSDLETVYGRLLQGVKHYRYVTVLEVLEALINRYKNLLDRIMELKEGLKEDISLALINGSSVNAITVNVGAFPSEKEKVYDEYVKLYQKDADTVASNDKKIAREVASLVFSDVTTVKIGRLDVKNMFGRVTDVYKSSLEKTEFYKDELDKDILRALRGSTEGKNASITYEQVFNSRYNPLRLLIDVSDERKNGINTVSKIILSNKIYNHIANNPEYYGGKTPEEYVSCLVREYAEYGTKICFSDLVNEKELYLFKEKDGFALDFVDFVNETSPDAIGYKAYNHSLVQTRKRQTLLWNPSLIYTRDESGFLPFVSPKMQKQYQCSVAKAVIYGLLKEDIILATSDKKYKIYFVKSGIDFVPASVCGRPVKKGDIRGLMRFIYANPCLTAEYADKFDAVKFKYSVDELADVMLELFTALEKQEAFALDGHARRIAQVVNDAFFGRYLDKQGNIDDDTACKYSRALRAHIEKLSEKLGKEQTEKYISWHNAQGYLLDYDGIRFCDFKF